MFAGLVAAALPDHREVRTVHGEFTSVVFPFLAQAGRGITVREVPLEHLADAFTAGTTLVSVSAVQSADGRVPAAATSGSSRRAEPPSSPSNRTSSAGWCRTPRGGTRGTIP